MEKPFVKKPDRIRAIGKVPQRLAAVFCDANYKPLPCPKPDQWLSIRNEPGQSYSVYTNMRITCRGSVCIQPLGKINEEDLGFFYLFASAFFHGASVEVLPAIAIKSLRVESRQNSFGIQYNAGQIISKLRKPRGSHCMLAITLKDLYPRDSWNFVYGLAGAETGVFSFIRHYPAHLPPEEAREVMLYHGCKTLVHEVSHMFGLKHCIYYKCLMNGNNGNQSTPGYLCPVCLRKLQSALNFDLASRFRALAETIADRPHQRWQKLLEYYQRMLERLA